MTKLIKYLEGVGVVAKPKIRAEIASTSTSEIKIMVTIPRHLIPDLVVLGDEDIAGDLAIDTGDLLTSDLMSPIDPTER